MDKRSVVNRIERLANIYETGSTLPFSMCWLIGWRNDYREIDNNIIHDLWEQNLQLHFRLSKDPAPVWCRRSSPMKLNIRLKLVPAATRRRPML